MILTNNYETNEWLIEIKEYTNNVINFGTTFSLNYQDGEKVKKIS